MGFLSFGWFGLVAEVTVYKKKEKTLPLSLPFTCSIFYYPGFTFYEITNEIWNFLTKFIWFFGLFWLCGLYLWRSHSLCDYVFVVINFSFIRSL